MLRVLLAPIKIEFIAVVAAAGLFVRARHIPAAPSVGVAALLLTAFILTGGHRSESWLVGLSIAALLPWLCGLERSGVVSIPDWLVLGGAASYAIYLTHNPLLSFSSRLLGIVNADWTVAIAISAVICVAAVPPTMRLGTAAYPTCASPGH